MRWTMWLLRLLATSKCGAINYLALCTYECTVSTILWMKYVNIFATRLHKRAFCYAPDAKLCGIEMRLTVYPKNWVHISCKYLPIAWMNYIFSLSLFHSEEITYTVRIVGLYDLMDKLSWLESVEHLYTKFYRTSNIECFSVQNDLSRTCYKHQVLKPENKWVLEMDLCSRSILAFNHV